MVPTLDCGSAGTLPHFTIKQIADGEPKAFATTSPRSEPKDWFQVSQIAVLLAEASSFQMFIPITPQISVRFYMILATMGRLFNT